MNRKQECLIFIFFTLSIVSNSKASISPLHTAVEDNNINTVSLILQSGFDVNIKTNYYNTPLHYASRDNKLEIAKLLVANNANINAANWYNFTPLHLSSAKGHFHISKFLIKNNANINAQTLDNQTPLHYASHNGHLSIAKLLIDHNANIYAKDLTGKTPLDLAKDFKTKTQLLAYIEKKAKIDVVKKLWEIENPTFTHYLQWPPQEIIDDLIQLIDTEN